MEKYSIAEKAAAQYQLFMEQYQHIADETGDEREARSICLEWIAGEQKQLPQQSIGFQLMVLTYRNLSVLVGEQADRHFAEQLPQLKTVADEAFESGILALSSQDFSLLPSAYTRFIEQGSSLGAILDEENRVRNLDAEALAELIAFQVALFQFAHALKTEDDKQEIPLSKRSAIGFTQAQKVLLFHYFLQLSNINPRANAGIVQCTELLYDFLGMEHTKIANSDLYKRLKKPLDQASPAQTIKNLEYIRSYFRHIPHNKLVELIDKDLITLRNNLKFSRE
jgi:hypothetical protein